MSRAGKPGQMGKPPQPPVPVTAATIASAIATSDDFGHEMRVRAVLKKHGAAVQHGWAYTDPIEEKPRQFDFRARLDHHSLPCKIQLPLECKNLDTEMPLVISGTARVKEEAFHDFIISDNERDRRFAVRSAGSHEQYSVGSFVGKSVLRLKPDKDRGVLAPSSNLESEVYARWSQALASAHELCARAMHEVDYLKRSVSTAVLPAVVVPNGTLWTTEYKEDGTIVALPAPSDSTTLFLKHVIEIVERNHWIILSHVHF